MTRPHYLQDVPPGRADALPGTPPHKKGTTMNNKTKGVIAGIAGIALLGGGTTFALWSDSATVAGGTITNGNLEVAAIGTLAWVDASSPRVDEDHTIDPATWRMVPGDVVEGTQGLGVALQGDNLVAELTVDAPEAVLATGVTVTYDVLHGATVVANDIPLGTTATLELAAPRAGQGGAPANTGRIIVAETTVPATANFSVVINVSLDAADVFVANESVLSASVLDDIVIELEQIRSGVDFS